ncbi:AAA family ATPase [uncultured Anaerococcus sp.]|uniref:AAA family ATPase n=1 Tax=uncultured Anaerococcus sp. TaxID=293428 RepID=UPI0025D6F189|nr:AAA family ATPase [uncultured Anaerococcus sp.]
MRLTQVKIKNFRSFGEEQVIDISNNTLLIGNNSSGKTTVLQAISKLFSNKQSDRIIRRSDFHLPRGEEPGKNRNKLHIETRFEFDELDKDGNSNSIPIFFQNLTVEDTDGKPFLRIRLESKYEDDGTSEGTIETNFFILLVLMRNLVIILRNLLLDSS